MIAPGPDSNREKLNCLGLDIETDLEEFGIMLLLYDSPSGWERSITSRILSFCLMAFVVLDLNLASGGLSKGPAIKPFNMPEAMVSDTFSPDSARDLLLEQVIEGRGFIWKAWAPSVKELIAFSPQGIT